MQFNPRNAGNLRAAWIALCVGYFIFGLWPFNFLRVNHAAWSPDGAGISFARYSVVHGESAVELQDGAGATSIELYLQPRMLPSRRSDSIVSLYDGVLPVSLAIGQRGSDLWLRIPVADARGGRNLQQFMVTACMSPGIRRFVVITSDIGGTAVYVDGFLAQAYPRLTLRPGTLRGRLIFGHAPQGRDNWEGKLLGMAAFRRALAPIEISRHHQLWTGNGAQALSSEPGLSALYTFTEGSGRTIQDHSPSRIPLVIPEFDRVLHKAVLYPPWRDLPDMGDVVVNILGFVPFGFLYFLYRATTVPGRLMRNAFWTVVLSGMISLAIELSQVYLPTRSSSLSDLISNIAGGLIGALAGAAIAAAKPHIPAR